MIEPDALHLIDDRGRVAGDGGSWLEAASTQDHEILARARGPVLDVGCGPGRHVRALTDAGVDALGIDLTPSMLKTARDSGGPVLAASVFDTLPRMGEWRTALLLDGNSGLGGNPLRLFRRLRSVLRPGGRILADLATGAAPHPRRLRLRHGASLGPSFAWAPLHVNDARRVAEAANAQINDLWQSGDRWFCELILHPTGPALSEQEERTLSSGQLFGFPQPSTGTDLVA